MSRYSDLVIADGSTNLLGYWPLDAEFGVTDKSTGGHNGTAAGGVAIGGATGPGELTATDFDGTDDRVTAGLSLARDGVVTTFEAWINRDTSSSNDSILASSVNGGMNLRATSGSGELAFFIPSVTATWSAALTTAAWQHVMVVFDESADTAVAYVNGVAKGSRAQAGAFGATPGTLVIGARFTSSDPFDGKQGHVAVYNGDQSALANVHYNAGLWALTSTSGPAPWFSAP